MLLSGLYEKINKNVMAHKIDGDEQKSDDLSPVSALRLRFDSLTPETADDDDNELKDERKIFGVSIPPFVRQRVVAWMGGGNTPKYNIDAGIHSNENINGERHVCIKKVRLRYNCFY